MPPLRALSAFLRRALYALLARGEAAQRFTEAAHAAGFRATSEERGVPMNVHESAATLPACTAYLIAVLDRETRHVVHIGIFSEPSPTTASHCDSLVLLARTAPTYVLAHAEVDRITRTALSRGGRA